MRCTTEDIQPIHGGLERHFEMRTLYDLDEVLLRAFFPPRLLSPGDKLHITRYVNETWRAAVAHWGHIAFDGVGFSLSQTAFETDRWPERGFVIDVGEASPLRNDGWFVFDSTAPPYSCRGQDIAVVNDGMGFHQHYTVRTLAPLDEMLEREFFAEVIEHFEPGDCLHVARFQNDDWRTITGILGFVRVDADGLIKTCEPIEFAARPEEGFDIRRLGNMRYEVRHKGRTVAKLGSLVEADEYIERQGWNVARRGIHAHAEHLGVPVTSFPTTRAAWNWALKQLA